MKNVHVLPTDKPSRLRVGDNGNFVLGMIQTSIQSKNDDFTNQHIYITSDASDEEIKVGGWVIQVNFEKTNTQLIKCVTKFQAKIANDKNGSYTKNKIILTTDQDLIKEGVQAIDDKFLEWFVKNPSCEWVEYIVEYKDGYGNWYRYDKEFWDKNSNKPIFSTRYKIIIPQEEPKQETLEEAALKYKNLKLPDDLYDGFISGAKWQAERMYSEEGVLKILRQFNKDKPKLIFGVEEWFEQFKNK